MSLVYQIYKRYFADQKSVLLEKENQAESGPVSTFATTNGGLKMEEGKEENQTREVENGKV